MTAHASLNPHALPARFTCAPVERAGAFGPATARPEPKVQTHVLWLRLAGARADCARHRAAGNMQALQDSCFVVTTLTMRLAYRLHQTAAPGRADPAPQG